MKTNIYLNNGPFIAGMTMKDSAEPEHNNMALHSCIDQHAIIRNRKQLASSLGVSLNDFVCALQTHSANFHKVTAADKGRGSDSRETVIRDTDALYTYEPNIVLCSFSADCVPVILYNRTNGLIGVVHSGWKGTIKEITLKLLEHLKENEGCRPEDFHVQIGAALSQEIFEVDKDVSDQFENLGYADDFIYFNEKTGKYHIDNQLTVKKQCEIAGIPADQIAIDRTCTFQSPDGFSYREDKKAGRHMSFIVKKEQ